MLPETSYQRALRLADRDKTAKQVFILPEPRDPIDTDDGIHRPRLPHRPTERSGVQLVWMLDEIERRYAWRIAHYGGVMLSPSEARVLQMEQTVMHERRLEYKRVERYADEYVDGLRADGQPRTAATIAGLREAYVDAEHRKIGRGVQKRMAVKLHVSESYISRTLKMTSTLLLYFVLRWPDVPVWVETRGGWVLNVPVSDFSVSRSEKRVS